MEDLKLGGYVRVSTQQQEDGTSPETQDERIREFGKNLGATLIEGFFERETWSGDDLDRPKLNRIRNGVAEGAIDGFIVYDADRLSRRALHLLFLKHEIREAGGTIYSVMNDLGDDSDVGDLITHVKGLAAQTERRQIAERSMRGKDKVARSGRLPCGTGAGLFGYDYDKVEKVRTINENEAPVVQQMYQWCSEGLSTYRIALRLNERNILTKRGNKWHPKTVERVLENRAYTGKHFYGVQRWRSGKGGRQEITDKPESEWILLDNFTPPIITEAQYEAVQERLSVRQAKADKRIVRRYLLTGIAFCKNCGTSLSGTSFQRERHRYYRCRGTWPTATKPMTCHERYIRANDLEAVVLRKVTDNIRDPSIFIANLEQGIQTGQGDLGAKMAELRREASKLRQQLSRLIELRQLDEIDLDTLKARIAPLQMRIDQKEAELQVLEDQQKQKDDAAEADQRIAEYFHSLVEGLEALDFDGQRAMLAAVGTRVEATVSEVGISLSPSPGVTAIGHTLASPRVRTGRSRLAGTRRGSRNS